MANMNCTNEDKFTRKDGICCDRCAAGQYMLTECDHTKTTKCAECGRGLYTATKNHMNRCQVCKECISNNNQRTVKDCTSQEDTLCECVPGFYCSNKICDHCRPVTHCRLGEGVKVQASSRNNTVCAPCGGGTYSNVTDFQSPCLTHTRCEDLGRILKTKGTPTTDAICGDFKSHCRWILPAGLWSGLVLTALVLFALICWRAKRKSYKADKRETTRFLQPVFTSLGAGSSVPITVVEMVPAAATFTQPEVSLPFTELNGHCQESCKLPLFNTGDMVVSCDTQDGVDSVDSVDGSPPITQWKASVSFTESNPVNGSAGCCNGNFLRTYSEPQEDEWCGT